MQFLTTSSVSTPREKSRPGEDDGLPTATQPVVKSHLLTPGPILVFIHHDASAAARSPNTVTKLKTAKDTPSCPRGTLLFPSFLSPVPLEAIIRVRILTASPDSLIMYKRN